MAVYAHKTALNAAIDAVITSNANNEITGAILRNLLKEIVTFCLPQSLVKGAANTEYSYLRVAGFDGTNNQAGNLRRGFNAESKDAIWKWTAAGGGSWEQISV